MDWPVATIFITWALSLAATAALVGKLLTDRISDIRALKDTEIAAHKTRADTAEARLKEYAEDDHEEAARESMDHEDAKQLGAAVANPDDDAGFDGVLRIADSRHPAGPTVDKPAGGPGAGDVVGHAHLEGAG